MPNPEVENGNYGNENDQKSSSNPQQIGAKVLASAKFERHPVTEKSFNRALKHGEKLPGKPAERRNLAHLNRLERIIKNGSSETEKCLWERAKKHIHLIQVEDITDATWRSILQDNRDHGGGDVELTMKRLT